jgi:hypothetical protein
MGDVLKPDNHAQCRRLAATRRTEKSDEPAFFDVEMEIHDCGCPVCIDFAETSELKIKIHELPIPRLASYDRDPPPPLWTWIANTFEQRIAISFRVRTEHPRQFMPKLAIITRRRTVIACNLISLLFGLPWDAPQ